MDSSDSQELIEALVDEFVDRQRRGDRPTVDEFVARHPELASEIREVLPALALMEQVAPGSADLEPLSSTRESLGQRPIEEIGDYRILREIGRGGMGVVYEAEQQSLGRRVALKVLPRQTVGDAHSLARFQREARAAARMHHSNIVPVFEVGNDQEHSFYAMQLITGQGLDQVIRDLKRLRETTSSQASDRRVVASRAAYAEGQSPSSSGESIAQSLLSGRFQPKVLSQNDVDGSANASVENQLDRPPASSDLGETVTHDTFIQTTSAVLPGQKQLSSVETNLGAYYVSVAQIGLQTASALSYAHARGIIHRDVKPSNLLLDTAGTVWVVDFGLAKTQDEAMTHTGDLIGTIRYMAPERFRGMCDVRADIYSLGLTLYEMLLFQPAFTSSDQLALIDQIKTKDASSLRAVDSRIPRDLETIVLKAIDKDAKRRYQSTDEMGEDLERFIRDEPIKARRVSAIERLSRWSRRNRVLAAALASIATLLLTGAIVSMAVAVYVQNINGQLKAQLYAQCMGSVSEGWSIDDLERMERELSDAKLHLKPGLEWYFMHSRYRDHFPEHTIDIGARVGRVAVAPNGGWIAISDETGKVCVRSGLQSSQPLSAIMEFEANGLATFSRDGTLLGIGGSNSLLHEDDIGTNQVTLIELSNRREVAQIIAGFDIFEFVLSPDSQHVAVVSGDGAVEMHRLADQIRVWQSEPRKTENNTHLSFSPNGRWLLAAGEDKKIIVYDALSGFEACRRTLDERCRALAVSPDGGTIATGGTAGIQFWKLSNEGELADNGRLRSHGFELAFSPDGEYLAAVDRQAIRIWDKISGHWRSVTTLLHRRLVRSIVFADSNILISGSEDGFVKVWNVSDIPSSTFVGNRNWFFGLDTASNGNIAFSDDPSGIVLWNPETGQKQRLDEHDDQVLTVAFSPDGSILASGSTDGKLFLWDVKSAERSAQLLAGQDAIWSVAFAQDGRLVAGDSSGRLWLWNDPTDEAVIPRKLRGSESRTKVYRVRFSPTGSLLAVGGAVGGRGRSEVWRMSTDEPTLLAQYDHTDSVYSVEFMANEDRLIVATRVSELEMFDLRRPGRKEPVFETTTPPFFTHSMARSPDGSRLLTASPNGQVRFWKLTDDRLENVGRFTLRERVREIAFAGDDSLITASEEGWVRSWPFLVEE